MPRKLIAIFILTFCFADQPVFAETAADYVKKPEGFYYWFGSMMYHQKACGFKMPEKLVDSMAARAGVTKKMVYEGSGYSIIQEGFNDAKNAAERDGISAKCAKDKAALDKLKEKG